MTWKLANWKQISELSLQEKKELLNSLENRRNEIKKMTAEEYRKQNKPSISRGRRADWTAYEYRTSDWNVVSATYSINETSNIYSVPISHDRMVDIQVEAIGSPDSIDWLEQLLTQ